MVLLDLFIVKFYLGVIKNFTPRPPLCHCLRMTNLLLSAISWMLQSNHMCLSRRRYTQNVILLEVTKKKRSGCTFGCILVGAFVLVEAVPPQVSWDSSSTCIQALRWPWHLLLQSLLWTHWWQRRNTWWQRAKVSNKLRKSSFSAGRNVPTPPTEGAPYWSWIMDP